MLLMAPTSSISGRISRIWFLMNMFSPNVLCYIKLLQSNEQRLTTVPVMIFGVSIEGNNDGSSMVNVRAVFLGHVIDCPFLIFIGKSSDMSILK